MEQIFQYLLSDDLLNLDFKLLNSGFNKISTSVSTWAFGLIEKHLPASEDYVTSKAYSDVVVKWMVANHDVIAMCRIVGQIAAEFVVGVSLAWLNSVTNASNRALRCFFLHHLRFSSSFSAGRIYILFFAFIHINRFFRRCLEKKRI